MQHAVDLYPTSSVKSLSQERPLFASFCFFPQLFNLLAKMQNDNMNNSNNIKFTLKSPSLFMFKDVGKIINNVVH